MTQPSYMQDLSAFHLIFELGGVLIAVPVRQVREVAPFAGSVPVPRAPDFVHGVTNHHGRIVLLLDLGRFLVMRLGIRGRPTHFLLLARTDVSLGIPCERVLRTVPLQPPAGEPMVPTDEGLALVVDLEQSLIGLESFFG
jgi:chemotaxis signal transduction protein